MTGPARRRFAALLGATLSAVASLGLAGCAVPGAATASPPGSPPPIASGALAATRPAVEEILRDEVAKHRLPCLAFGVVDRGGLVYFVGVGARDRSGAEVTVDTVFRIGSVTKTFTGMALLILRDEGKLGLDDPVVKYLPELAGARAPTSDSGPITLRHLVTHTSGLPRVGSLSFGDSHMVTRVELRAAAAGAVLEFPPGTRAVYSNLAMALAGPVIERVSGEGYRTFIRGHILGPLGMLSTVWDPEAVPEGMLAQGFAEDKGGGFSPSGALWRLGAAEAMGGLYSTIADMGRYVAFQLSAWPPRDGADAGPLRRSSVRESQLVAGFAEPRGEGFGVNWIIKAEPRLGHVVFHNGATEGYHASVWMVPQRGVGVVALGPATFALDAISHRALEAALGLPAVGAATPGRGRVPPGPGR